MSTNMKAIIVFCLLICFCGISFVFTQEQVTRWPCRNRTIEKNVDMEKIRGVWYMQMSFNSFPMTSDIIRQSQCRAIRLAGNSSDLLMTTAINFPRSLGKKEFVVTKRFTIQEGNPELWESEHFIASTSTTAVLDQPVDGSTVILTNCMRLKGELDEPLEWTGVFSRAVQLDSSKLDKVEQRLRNAGFSIPHYADWWNNTQCEAPPSLY